MKHHVSIILGVNVWLVSIGCQPTAEHNARGKNTFATRPDTELYFKNVRQLFYQREEQAATQLHLYRLHQTPATLSAPDVSLRIAHNWRYSEAYILLEANAALAAIPLWEIEAVSPKGAITRWQYRPGDKKEQQQFAYRLYEALVHNCSFQLYHHSKKYPFLARAQAREAARITLKDYRRLVGADD